MKLPLIGKLDYAIFFDEEIRTDQISVLYADIMKTLFSKYKEYFLGEEISKIVKLTKDKDNLRLALDIGENYFIESHSNNKAKFNKIKQILTILDLEDELFIKYKED